MLISQAFAQATETTTQTASMGSGLAQLLVIIIIFYFIVLRPQQKRIKKHEAELNAIIKGTEIVVGGFVGKVVKIKPNNQLLVELADGIQVTVLRSYVSQVKFETSPEQIKK